MTLKPSRRTGFDLLPDYLGTSGGKGVADANLVAIEREVRADPKVRDLVDKEIERVGSETIHTAEVAAATSRILFRFGECELDVDSRALRRLDRSVSLQPRRFDMLVFLIEHRDRVVSREELLAALWTGEFVTASALGFCIKGVRAAIGDTGTGQRFIRTYRGRGYRFVADVEAVIQSATGPAREMRAPRTARLSDPHRALLEIAAVLGQELPRFRLAGVAARMDPQLDESVVGTGLDEAIRQRLLEEVPDHPERLCFVDPSLREFLSSELSSSRRQEIHAAIVSTLEQTHPGERTALLPQLADHAFHCARNAESVTRAVGYLDEAARESLRRRAFDDAAGHYGRAVSLLQGHLGPSSAHRIELLISLAHSHLHCGRAKEARRAFVEATEAARGLGDAQQMARAALGYGAITNTPGRPESTLNILLEEALQLLPSEESSLRAECMARLAWVQSSKPGTRLPQALSRSAVAMARSVGDREALARTLLCRHQAISSPDTQEERHLIANEVLRLADASGDDALRATMLSLHIADLLEASRGFAADSALDRFAQAVEHMGIPWLGWRLRIQLASRALRVGELDEALRVSEKALNEGNEIQPELAMLAFGVHLCAVSYARGDLSEIQAVAGHVVDQRANIPAMRVLLALSDAESGDPAKARSLLRELAQREFSDIERDAYWIPTLAMLARLAALLEDRRAAEILYALLRPFDSRGIVIGPSIATLGSVALPLGTLATTLEQWAAADEHFALARSVHEQLGSLYFNAHVDLQEGQSLLLRPSPQKSKARQLLSRARAQAQALGLKGIESSLRTINM